METESELKLSALQLNSIVGDIDANISKVEKLIEEGLDRDSDVIILPEVWTVGWDCSKFAQSAQNTNNSSVINFLSNIAQKYNVFVIGGSFIRKDDSGKLYNSCPIFDRKGKLLGIYDKNHLYSYCGCTENSYITPGENGILIELDGVKTGITICYDIRFPEIFREYRKHGAQLLINCAAWGASKPIPWEMLTKARAIENQAYLVALTQCGKIDESNFNIGHSRIIDFVGNTISEIKDQKEGFMTATINLKAQETYRNECTILKDLKNNYEVKCI